MEKLVRGLHHVTATVSDAQQDFDFYTKILGLRLVKKTVNFDNHNVYHFYYGNETGVPGTIMTTFPYKGWGVPVGQKGAGQIRVTSFSVPAGSLGFWKTRLREGGATVRDEHPRFGEESITVSDPSGLVIELVATPGDERSPWVPGDVPAEHAIRGVHSVTMPIRAPAKTLELMTEVLGFDVVNEGPDRTRVAVNGDLPGRRIDVVHAPDAAPGINGLGTVHHVAMAVADADEQLRMRAELLRLGFQVTQVMDRQYFRSIYFREPGGVLFELATVPPGFTVDETLPCLGQDLKLPPWEEPNRAAIEAKLPPISKEPARP
ncbi:MAG TPA: ring-cleaving dioxygenase [Gemmatimonadales bacterium]|nr:ring-cleaving dioxygenase [Gemmatimonadales bacterium]